jgi:hypothetical protein
MSQEIQIIELASQGAAAEEIAKELDMETAAVEYVLRRQGMIKDEEITDDDFEAIRTGLVGLAKYSKNEFVKAKVGIFLYERKKGPTNSLKGAPAVNIGNLNLLIAASHNKVLKALGGVDIEHNGSNSRRSQGDSQEHSRAEPSEVRTAAECQALEEKLNSQP